MSESHLTVRKWMVIIAKWPFSRADVLSTLPLRGREENGTSRLTGKSGRSRRRTEGSSQYRCISSSTSPSRGSGKHGAVSRRCLSHQLLLSSLGYVPPGE